MPFSECFKQMRISTVCRHRQREGGTRRGGESESESEINRKHVHNGGSLARGPPECERDREGEQRDREGEQRDREGEQRDREGKQGDREGEQRDREGEQRERRSPGPGLFMVAKSAVREYQSH